MAGAGSRSAGCYPEVTFLLGKGAHSEYNCLIHWYGSILACKNAVIAMFIDQEGKDGVLQVH